MATQIHGAGPTGERSPGLELAIAGYLAENPPAGGGSGGYPVQQVTLSGAATVDTTGWPTDQVVHVVYTQDSIGGHVLSLGSVTLASGAAWSPDTSANSENVAVFRHSPTHGWVCEGYWVSVSGFIPVSVTPAGPDWVDDAVNGGGTWTTPDELGVTYDPASGTADPGEFVEVTATADEGFAIAPGANSSWSHTFPLAGGGGGGQITLTPINHFAGTSAAGVSIGAADADRSVIVAYGQRSSSEGGAAPTGCTIGGVTATRDTYNDADVVGHPITAIFHAEVPSGTTADITLTGGSGLTEGSFYVWTADAPLAKTDGGVTPRGNAQSITLGTSNEGVAVGILAGNFGASPSVLGSPFTERFLASFFSAGDAETDGSAVNFTGSGYQARLAVVTYGRGA